MEKIENEKNDKNNNNDSNNDSNYKNQKIPIEKIREEYNIYINHKFKYPKGQFCKFFFRGTCTLENKCQFAHGMTDFSFDNYLKFINDPEAIKTESQNVWQPYYYYRLFKEYSYDNLMEYQKKHKELFKVPFTLEEMRAERNKRDMVRMSMAKEIISQFLKIFFEHFPVIKSVLFNQYLLYAGYPYSLKDLIKDNSKLFFTRNIQKNIYLIKFESPDVIFNRFIQILINEFKSKENFDEIFPISYKTLIKIINRHIGEYEPNTHQYMNLCEINEKEFLKKITDECMKESNKINLKILKGKKEEELFYNVDINSLINSVFENIYEKHFNENNTPFAYIYFDFIENTCLKKIISEIKHSEKDLFYIGLKFKIFQEKSLLFFDNTQKINIFNFNKFKNFDDKNFYNSYYYSKCNKNEDLDIDLMSDFEKLTLNNIQCPKENIYNIEETEIKFINNENSLNYFYQKSKNFQVICIDLEGHLSINNPVVNLIQICDNSNNKSEIFIIDIYTFINPLNKNAINLIKYLFENKNIKKIFFDGRNDVASLHVALNICVKNYIDLSPLYSAVNSFEELLKFKSKELKEFGVLFQNCRNKFTFQSLNTVLYEYHPNHCINQLKDKYHTLFKKEPLSKWTKRPILEEFLYYSALDVKYEFDTYMSLRNKLKTIIINFYNVNELKNNEIDLIILLISSGHLRFACDKYKNLISKTKISE